MNKNNFFVWRKDADHCPKPFLQQPGFLQQAAGAQAAGSSGIPPGVAVVTGDLLLFHCLRKAAIFVSCSPSSRVLKLAAVVACVVVAVDRFPTLQVSLLLPWQ